MELYFIKRLFGRGKRKSAKPRHTSSTSRELDQEFLDYAVQGFRRRAASAEEQAAE